MVALVYLTVVAVIFFTPDNDIPMSGVRFLRELAVRHEAPVWVVAHVEVLANVAILVPGPLIATYVWRPLSVLTWTGGAFVLSVAVEVSQLGLLGERDPSVVDVVANTIGGLVGGVLAALAVSVTGRWYDPWTPEETRARWSDRPDSNT